MDEGTRAFDTEVGRLGDDELWEPSALADWSRAHVVAHIARNADALGNLLAWARTGVETPMYESAQHRAAGIEDGASQSADVLRLDLDDAKPRFAAAIASLPAESWWAEIRTRAGRAVPAAEVPWMRCREIWVHAVDLGTGASFAGFPQPMVEAFLDEVSATFTARPECPGIELVAADTGRSWAIGPRGSDDNVIEGRAHELLAWLIGRSDGNELRSTAPRPALPTWL